MIGQCALVFVVDLHFVVYCTSIYYWLLVKGRSLYTYLAFGCFDYLTLARPSLLCVEILNRVSKGTKGPRNITSGDEDRIILLLAEVYGSV